MNNLTWKYLLLGPWLVLWAYWAISALNTRRTQKKEPFIARYGVVFIEVVGFTLLFDSDAGIGFFGHRVIPRISELRLAGVLLTWAGIALALWARWHLGQYWSGRITIKEDHRLIRSGPYAHLRHPIYTGLDLAVTGTALLINQWRCVIGVCVIVTGFWIKAKREEAMLGRQFGEEFQEHRRYTGFLLPKLRRSWKGGFISSR